MMASIHRVLSRVLNAILFWCFGGLKRIPSAVLPLAAGLTQHFNPYASLPERCASCEKASQRTIKHICKL